jgi:hypothetical protein
MKIFTLLLPLAVLSNFLSAQRLYFSQASNIPVFINDTITPILNPWSGGINYPLWSGIDMNGDGLTDLYMYDRSNGRVLTFINDGSTNFNAFHDSSSKYAPLFPTVYTMGSSGYIPGWGKCYDYNCDGKPDFFTISPLGSSIALYRNDYTSSTGLKWSLVTNQIEEQCNTFTNPIWASPILIPTFVDMDNDGDMDMLGFNSVPDIHLFYHKNYAMEDFGRCDTFVFHLETKCWGNFALSYGSNQYSCIHCPCGTLTCPLPEDEKRMEPDPVNSEIIPNPPVARRDDTVTSLLCLDLDGDGKKDLLVGDVANPNCLMLHNGGTLAVAEIDNEDVYFPSYNHSVKDSDFVYSAYIDVDNDGLNDLITSSANTSDRNNIWVYKNDSTNSAPKFNFQRRDFVQGSMIDEGEAAEPILFDYDADGLKDLIIAYGVAQQLPSQRVHSKLAVYKNIGTATNPQFKFITDDYMGIDQYALTNPICVTFGDLRCRGAEDMIIGDAYGNLYYFQNSSAAGQPANFPTVTGVKYCNIDVGNNAAPQLVDMDNDGKLDLVIGAESGTVLYYHNNGATCATPSFNATPDNATLGNVNVKWEGLYGYSVPYVFKNNGVTEMLVSNNQGVVYYYNNIDGNLGGTFNKVDSFFNGSLGIRTNSNLTVTVGDINSDTMPDMLVGLFTGGAQIYYGTHTPNVITEVENNNSFICFPNPTSQSAIISWQSSVAGNIEITIINVLGEKIYSKQLQTSNPKPQTTIDVSRLSTGLYIVVVSTSQGVSYQKLLVSH